MMKMILYLQTSVTMFESLLSRFFLLLFKCDKECWSISHFNCSSMSFPADSIHVLPSLAMKLNCSNRGREQIVFQSLLLPWMPCVVCMCMSFTMWSSLWFSREISSFSLEMLLSLHSPSPPVSSGESALSSIHDKYSFEERTSIDLFVVRVSSFAWIDRRQNMKK